MSHWITVGLLALTFLTVGCEVSRESETELKIAKTQTVIQAYSDKVVRADEYQASFVEAWESANEIKDLQVFREAMTAGVIPKLQQYLTWLESMLPSKTDSVGLNKIHGRLIEGYRSIITAFDVFVVDLSEENIEDRYRVLMGAMNQLARMEDSYAVKLKNFYSKNRVRMMKDTIPVTYKAPVVVEPTPSESPDGGN